MTKERIFTDDKVLVQVPINGMWGLGRTDTKETFCIGAWGPGGFFDLYEENESEEVDVDGQKYTVRFGCYFVKHRTEPDEQIPAENE